MKKTVSAAVEEKGGMFSDLFEKFEKALNSNMKTEVQDALDGVRKAEAKYQA